MKKTHLFLIFLFLCQLMLAQNNSIIRGVLVTPDNQPISNAAIYIDGNKLDQTTLSNGEFEISGLAEGEHKVTFISPDSKKYSEKISVTNNETRSLVITMRTENSTNEKEIEDVYVYGTGNQPKGMDVITRIPISPREMPQNISVITNKIIEEQGAQNITDAVRNVPGVILFGTYGGGMESMSIRGYRGTPVLKNGIQVDSDFRSASLMTDMQGVQSIQVLKGSASITQGIGNNLGSPGGVINVVTKTPQFLNGGNVSLMSGSWGLFRPTFDYQTVLDKKQTAAFRINGAYQRADSYKSRVNSNRIYVNPSFEWRPDDKTQITLEMDYMNNNHTPDRGTVNFGLDTENHLYEMPHNKFTGWGTDNENIKTTTYSAKIVRNLGHNLSLRALYAASDYKDESYGMGSIIRPLIIKKEVNYFKRVRNLGWSESEDKNKVIQIDLIGKEIYTGKIKHTFQVGFDYKRNDKSNTTHKASVIDPSTGLPKIVSSIIVDTIKILDPIPNNLPNGIGKKLFNAPSDVVNTKSDVYGIMVQEAIEINKYIRANLALRYSQNSIRENSNAANEAWDPFFGLMVTPIENISVFGNYATTTDLRSANNPTPDGSTLGASTTKQWEFGVKSDWFNKKLAFNVSYFHIRNNDLSYQVYNAEGSRTGLFELAGDVTRKGMDLEVTGKIFDNLKVIAGYSYLDAKYKNSPAYHNGSRPMNTPYNTANGWVQYLFNKGTLKNLSIGVGVYYVGDRPINDYSIAGADPHGNNYPKPPFNMPEYTTFNAQLGYTYQNIGLQVFFNNIFDEVGYTSYYRGGFIDQIDPRNFKVQLSYKF